MASKAVIFESRYAGHTVGFATEFAEAFSGAGFDTVLVLNGQGRGHPQITETIGPDPAYRIEWTEPFDPVFASVEQGGRELALLGGIADRLRPDRLIVPTGDAIARALPLSTVARDAERKLPRLDIVLHHIAAAYLPSGISTWRRWRRGLAELGALKRHRLLTCDAYIGLGSGGWATRPSGVGLTYVPHLLNKVSPFDFAAARTHFGLPPEARVLVSIGDVAHRKGIDKLIAAAEHPDWPEDLALLLAGPVSGLLRPELARIEKALPGRVHVIDRFLSDEEFAAAFVAADLIWAVTPTNLGVSSTFLYAARHARPAIVASAHRSARWMCGRIGPGVTSDLDPRTICDAVRQALAAPAQTPKQAKFLSQIIDRAGYERIAVAP